MHLYQILLCCNINTPVLDSSLLQYFVFCFVKHASGKNPKMNCSNFVRGVFMALTINHKEYNLHLRTTVA